MFPGAKDLPAHSNDKSNDAQNGLAQAITGRVMFTEVEKSGFKAAVQGATDGMRTAALGSHSQDMNAAAYKLQQDGHMPVAEKVADLKDATPADRSAPLAAMMAPKEVQNVHAVAEQKVMQNV